MARWGHARPVWPNRHPFAATSGVWASPRRRSPPALTRRLAGPCARWPRSAVPSSCTIRPAGVEDGRGRQAGQAVAVADLAVSVPEVRIAEVELADQPPGAGRIVAVVDPDDRRPVQGAREPLELRRLVPAGLAPARPEVDRRGVAAQRGNRHPWRRPAPPSAAEAPAWAPRSELSVATSTAISAATANSASAGTAPSASHWEASSGTSWTICEGRKLAV